MAVQEAGLKIEWEPAQLALAEATAAAETTKHTSRHSRSSSLCLSDIKLSLLTALEHSPVPPPSTLQAHKDSNLAHSLKPGPPQVPALALGQLLAPPSPSAEVPAQQPLPGALYTKSKPKPVDLAFGRRVEPAASPRTSRSSLVSRVSVLDGQCGSLVGATPRISTPTRRYSSSNTDGAGRQASSAGAAREGGRRSSWSGDSKGSPSRIPKTPRSTQTGGEATQTHNISRSSSSAGSSRIPKPRVSSSSSSRTNPPSAAGAAGDGETIHLSCEGDSKAAAGAAGSGSKGTFTLSCAISAVFSTHSSGDSKGEGTYPKRLLSAAAAALGRTLLSSAQQGEGCTQQQQQLKTAPNTMKISTSSKAGAVEAPAAAARAAGKPSKVAAAAATSTALVPRCAPRRATTPAAAAAAAVVGGRRLTPGQSSSGLSRQGSDAQIAAPEAAATILVQLQGTFDDPTASLPSSAGGASFADADAASEAFHSTHTSEAGSSVTWRSCSDRDSWKSFPVSERSYRTATSHQSVLAVSRRPSAAAASMAGASAAGDPAAAAAVAAAAEAEVLSAYRTESGGVTEAVSAYSSANDVVSSWMAGAEVDAVAAAEDSLSTIHPDSHQQQQQQEQQQQLDAGCEASVPAAAAAAAAEPAAEITSAAAAAPTAAAAAAVASKAGPAEEREVLLTIAPSALPFLAKRALTKTPIRLVITPDAVYGDTAAFRAAPQQKARNKTPRSAAK